MDKQNVGYPGNRVFFSHKKKGRTDICYNIDEVKVARQKGQTLYDSIHVKMPRTGKFIELESRFMVARGQGVGRWG